MSPDRIVFFDGVCGLCNATVDFLLARDSGHRLLFAPLQGETARKRLPASIAPDSAELKTILFLDEGTLRRRSTAVLRAVAALGGIWNAALLLLLIPRPLRDFVYDVIAHNRYAWFGKRDTCRLPGPGERGRILP